MPLRHPCSKIKTVGLEPKGLLGVGVPLAAVVRARSPSACLLPTGGEGQGSREGSVPSPARLELVNRTVMECISLHSNRFKPSSWL